MVQVMQNSKLIAPPTAKGFPLIGALPDLLRKQVDYLEYARAAYGDIYVLKLGPMSMIMLNRPEYAQYVLRDRMANYSKDGPIWDSVRALSGNGLTTSSGDYWLRQRRMMQPHFHRQRLGALTEIMVSTIAQNLQDWDQFANQADPVEITHQFGRMTMPIIMRTMFGMDISAEEISSMGEKMTYIVDNLLSQAVINSIPGWMPIPKRAVYQRALKDVETFVYTVVEKRRKNVSNDLLSMLIEAIDSETGEQMTNQQVHNEVVTIFVAGYETVALTLAWALYYLTQQPALIERLQHEVDSVLGQRPPTVDDLPRLAYTRQVFQETLRLAPPGYFLPRTAVEDDVIDGFHIPAGKMVAVSLYTIHRHPEFWQSPHTFDPDRFSPAQSEKHHPMAWIPFGAGPRFCMGRDFAYMEGSLILAMLIQRFTVTSPAGFVTKPRLSFTLHPNNGVLVHCNHVTDLLCKFPNLIWKFTAQLAKSI